MGDAALVIFPRNIDGEATCIDILDALLEVTRVLGVLEGTLFVTQ